MSLLDHLGSYLEFDETSGVFVDVHNGPTEEEKTRGMIPDMLGPLLDSIEAIDGKMLRLLDKRAEQSRKVRGIVELLLEGSNKMQGIIDSF